VVDRPHDSRPDPDAVLAQLQRDEPAARARGRLKVFLGATAGVGKTYAMLQEAGERARAGTDVLAGVVETHGRKETEALLQGLEVLPRRNLEYRGVALREFDLDAALARRPQLVLIDELAHSNAPGSRHAKRWTDVEELLAAGISVFTTVNVQHLESLNDLVARITHVVVRETVPDSVLEQADEIELIDLPPDELLQRLREGKVYIPQQAQRAAQGFFRKGNLIALRQIALRKAAERVDAQMRLYRRAQGVAETGRWENASWWRSGRHVICPAGARGQAHGGPAACRVDCRLRGDTALRALVRAGPRAGLGNIAARRTAGCFNGHAERAARHRRDPRLRPPAQRLEDRGGQALAPPLARPAPGLEAGRSRAGQC
jgi:two-component system sensor histidine kinase KdpD